MALGPLSNSLQIARQAISGVGAVPMVASLAQPQVQPQPVAQGQQVSPQQAQLLLNSMAALASQGRGTMAVPQPQQAVPMVPPPGGDAQVGGAAKGKGRGKPPHAGGPKAAYALPPGLQGKELPPGNPWRAVQERLAAQQKAAQQKMNMAPMTGQPQPAGGQAPVAQTPSLQGVQEANPAALGANIAGI